MDKMTNPSVRLVMFDMAGTTVRDNDEVLHCFAEACRAEGITADRSRLNALMGVSKLEVFGILWREQLGAGAAADAIAQKAQESFRVFRAILEDYYRNHEVEPAEGALDVFRWCRERDIKIALNTGFYRAVTDIILDKLGWLAGLDAAYKGGPGSVIDYSVASDEVPQGRPAPFMIQKAMSVFGIDDPQQVVKVGDTPVDLAEGRNAGCLFSLAVVNGTHSRAELELFDHDGLLSSLRELPAMLEKHSA
ncbi:MAG: HAD hydrolase-like protein [Lewinellaceae bacterium]|nr:HAD hydrolase-like protein [Lewinellaceae bacterium]